MDATLFVPKGNPIIKALAYNIDHINKIGIHLTIEYDETLMLKLPGTSILDREKILYFLMNGQEKEQTPAEYAQERKAMFEKREKKTVNKEQEIKVTEYDPEDKEQNINDNVVANYILGNIKRDRIDVMSHIMNNNF